MLLITVLIESLILLFIIRFLFKNKKLSLKKIFSFGILASALTLPYLWFVLPSYIALNYYIFVGELVVIVIEAVIYNNFLGLNLKKAVIASFICNVFSFAAGLLIF